MEDILSSIRRVIARDEAPGAREARFATESEDVLDLDEQESHDEPAPVIPTEDELVSAASADAARQSLEALTAAVAPAPVAATPAPAGGRTMEEVVLEALRPMLKDWLDTNLPAMVEAMVAKEISRITGKKF
jgi:uncharacterized protein